MTGTNSIVREQGVSLVESDVPAHLTLSQYRAQRHPAPRRRRPRIRRRASR
jgi:hypothetical protein